MSLIGEMPQDLTAILITHEHCDHVSGMVRLARRFRIPVYLSELTAPAIDWEGYTPCLETFQAGTRFPVGDFEVTSFTVPHDARDPVGFTLQAEGIKCAVATDLGYITESIRYHLRRSHVLLLESNHDLDMLKVGPYPWSVKQRVMSRVGHLSNMGACDFLEADLDAETSELVLGHLSEHNNHPEIVRLGARQTLERRGLKLNLTVATQRNPTEVFTF